MKTIIYKWPNLLILCLWIIGYTTAAKSMDEHEVTAYVRAFASKSRPQAYRELNEGTDLIERYNKTHQVPFALLTEEEYREFITSVGLFDTKASPIKKVFNLMWWCQLTGCPLLAVNQYREFFYSGLHVYAPKDAKKFLGANTLSDEAREELSDNFDVYPYAEKCRMIVIKKRNDKNNKAQRERALTKDLKDNAIMYLYLNAQGTKCDKQQFNLRRPVHHHNFGFARISYEFLQDYIVPLGAIRYIDDVLQGLARLPKVVVDVMRGKAIYLSTQQGRSLHMHTTSHNAPVTTYLGFIPGVFIENGGNEDGSKRFDRRIGISMTERAVVHEVGHLVDYTVLQVSVSASSSTPQRSIAFPYQFPQFHPLKSRRDDLFTGNPGYEKPEESDLDKDKPGYVTNYSESSAAEDFAEHFTYRVLFPHNFLTTAIGEGSNLLLSKYNFMESMLATRLDLSRNVPVFCSSLPKFSDDEQQATAFKSMNGPLKLIFDYIPEYEWVGWQAYPPRQVFDAQHVWNLLSRVLKSEREPLKLIFDYVPEYEWMGR